MFDIGVDNCCHDCFDCSCSCFGTECIDSNNNSAVSSKADGARSLIIVVFFVILTKILLIFLCISMGLFILISMWARLLLISIFLRTQLRKSHFEIQSQQLLSIILDHFLSENINIVTSLSKGLTIFFIYPEDANLIPST